MPPRSAVQRQLDALRQVRTPDRVEPALAALEMVGAPAAEIAAAIRDAYRRLSEGPRRDPGCHTRAALLRALRDRGTVEDVPLLVAAVDTYEYAPPSFSVEVAMMLRSAALVVLSQIDPPLAAYHACAHLDDADPMSAEPALTAVQVLGAQHQLPPLYAYACTHDGGDVVAECLRQLGPAPASILDRLLERYRGSEDQAVLASLIDVLLAHPEREQAAEELLRFLGEAPLDVFRYGATLLVARREVELASRLGQHPAVTAQTDRARLWAEAAALLPRAP